MKRIFSISPNFRIFLTFCIIFIANCTLLIENCFSQSITWQRTYTAYNGGGGSGYGVCKADGTNMYLVGYSFAPTVPYFYILKINEYGDTIWTKIFGYGGKIYSVVSSGDGGCVFTGDWGQAFAIKINSNGDTVWQKFYTGNRCFDIKKNK